MKEKCTNEDELKLLMAKGMKAYEDDADFEAAYKIFNKALKIKPNDPKINMLFAICKYYVDIDSNDYELSQFLFNHMQKAVENGLIDLGNDEIEDLLGTVVIHCVQTNEDLHKKCTQKKSPISHKDLVINIRAIEMNTGILEYVVAILEKKYQNCTLLLYIDALKEISLRLSIMFGKYMCNDCSGLCTATNWNYIGKIDEKFNEVNAKILKLDPTYIIPKQWKGFSKMSIFMNKLFRNKNKYCEKCSKKLTIEEITKVNPLGVRTSESAVYADVFLVINCEDCGTISTPIIKNRRIKWIDSNGWMRESSIEDEVEKYFK